VAVARAGAYGGGGVCSDVACCVAL